MGTDWSDFVESVPWLLRGDTAVEVGDLAPFDPDRVDHSAFPILATLLSRARVTPVSIDGRPHELVTWPGRAQATLSWLCLPPFPEPPTDLFSAHRELLSGFGGIIERHGGEPDTWLMNCSSSLTVEISRRDATFIEEFYGWLREDAGLDAWPIDLKNFYSISDEANGNATLCHRRTGEVVLFAPDHCFDHIKILDRCPPCSLYRIPEAPDFTTWVESVAGQWLAATDSGSQAP